MEQADNAGIHKICASFSYSFYEINSNHFQCKQVLKYHVGNNCTLMAHWGHPYPCYVWEATGLFLYISTHPLIWQCR